MALPEDFQIKIDTTSGFTDDEMQGLPRQQRILEDSLGGTKYVARTARSLAQQSGLSPEQVVEYCERSSHIAQSPVEDFDENDYYGHISRLRQKY